MLAAKLVDTTLRDGEQAPGLAFSLAARLNLARALDEAGLYQIEAGCPAMGLEEEKAIRAIKAVCSKALVSTWNRILIEDVQSSMRTGVDIIHLCLPITKSHLTLKIGRSWEEVLARLAKCLDLLDRRQTLVTVGLEDASRATDLELSRAAECLWNFEITRVRLSDTVGILTPSRTRSLVKKFIDYGFLVEFHGHNDLGLAEANTLAAALAGAEYLDTTLTGVGERAGNCGLARLVELAGGKLALGVTKPMAQQLEAMLPGQEVRRSYIKGLLKSQTPIGLECRERQ